MIVFADDALNGNAAGGSTMAVDVIGTAGANKVSR